MRFRHPDGSTVHLAYCTNVHPAETLDGVLAQLRDHCEPVRRRLGRDRLGIGLWLAKDAAHALVTDPAALRGLRAELDRRGLEVVTLNGFPYEGFGAEEVKYRVYKPDWADPERLAHTTDLARAPRRPAPRRRHRGHHLHPAARLAHRLRRHARPQAAHSALATLAERLDALEELTGTLHPHRPGTGTRLHRRDHRRRHRPAHRDRPRPHRHLRRHLPPRHLLRRPAHRPGRAHRGRRPRRQGPALRRPARRTPPPPRGPRGARRLRRTPLPAPDPHPHRRRPARHRRPRRGPRRATRCPTPPPGAPTSTSRCTPRPPRRSPPPSPYSRTR